MLSAIVGIFISSSLLNAAIEQVSITVTRTELLQFQMGMSVAFIVSAFLCILGVFAALLQTKTPQMQHFPDDTTF